ncbi:contractile injection system protein, VgrG/Pvc8 family [Bartonella machadoae]|uniref:contractile injection system protein, VgrG/Pvc8 family n=1 Tax=Bartonella machadoae TaxID=2893471 RepID=UPI001F4CEDCA|nr:contractile injection system protein, VgrG/Pvc8 family [Bartonella machadoae]UNE54625.1 late control protein [Bartonella machadoae]UNE55241.1 late control protein [Bartonella machadoae]
MKPFCMVMANGQDITKTLMDYVLSIEITDEAEDKSDRITIELDDRARNSDNGFLDIPLIGTVLSVTLGYEGDKIRDMGAYLIDEISVSSPPQSLTVTGRAAAMNTSYRTPKSQSYHQQTLGHIVQEIAQRNGYTAKVDPSLAKIVVRHIDQTSESDMAFAARLAEEYDAVAKPVDGKLVLAKRGEGKAITGETLPIVVLHEEQCTCWDFKYSARDEAGAANGLETDGGEDQKAAADARAPEEIEEDENTIHMDENDLPEPSESERGEKTEKEAEKQEQEKKGGVIATYYDLRSGEKKEVKSGHSPFHELKYTYHNQSEAVAAIAAYRNKSSRGKSSFSCDIGGDPFVQAEAKLVQEPPFRPYIPAEWRIKSVKHKLDKTGGYTTKIECELFDEGQEDAAGNVANTTPDKDDTLDSNAPQNAYDEGEGVIHMDEEDT